MFTGSTGAAFGIWGLANTTMDFQQFGVVQFANGLAVEYKLLVMIRFHVMSPGIHWAIVILFYNDLV